MDYYQEYADLLKRAHDLGIISIGDTIINPDILRDAIANTERNSIESKRQQAAELPQINDINKTLPTPVAPTTKLTHCTIQPDISLLRDVVEAIEEHPIDFKAIAKKMDEMRQNPER